MIDLVIDTTGLTCPLPFLKLRRTLRDVAVGAQVDVLSTDPLAPGDFRELCEAQGHDVISSEAEGSITRTRIRVNAAVPTLATGTGS